MSAVPGSALACGAATTRPGVPIRMAILPGASVPSSTTGRVLQPTRSADVASTLPSAGSRIARTGSHDVGGIVGDEHRLRQRAVAVMRESEEHAGAAAPPPDLARSAAEHERGRLAALANDLELAPLDPQAQPRSERLQPGLLGREARGEVRHRIATSPAVGDL